MFPLLLPFIFHPNYCSSLFHWPTASILLSLQTLLRTLSRRHFLKLKSALITPWLNTLTIMPLSTLYKQSPYKDFQSSYVRVTCHLSKSHLPCFSLTVFHLLRPPCCSRTHQVILPQGSALVTPSAWYALLLDLCLLHILTFWYLFISQLGLPWLPFQKIATTPLLCPSPFPALCFSVYQHQQSTYFICLYLIFCLPY